MKGCLEGLYGLRKGTHNLSTSRWPKLQGMLGDVVQLSSWGGRGSGCGEQPVSHCHRHRVIHTFFVHSVTSEHLLNTKPSYCWELPCLVSEAATPHG